MRVKAREQRSAYVNHTRNGLASCTLSAAALLGLFVLQGASPPNPARPPAKRALKVLIISMIAPEGQSFVDKLALSDAITVPGLAPDSPALHCNSDDVCQVTTGMGHTNAAASISALVYSSLFDLTHTYFLVAGIAGIDPTQGTLGSAAWARYLIDFSIAWEIDAREKPSEWSTGYLGINTKAPDEKPALDYRTEVFQLNETLLQKALSLSAGAQLEDSDTASAYRTGTSRRPTSRPQWCSVIARRVTLGGMASCWNGARKTGPSC
jgi:purine nucleoside permease